MKINKSKIKRELLPFIILYVLVELFLVSNFVVSLHESVDITNLFERIKYVAGHFGENITSFKFLSAAFIDFSNFINFSTWTLFIFAVLFVIWKLKNGKESEYDGIENGSSDWAKNGEEFEKLSDGREVLNRKEGFILSKDHRLGTDLKKVLINKNILVVGRFWCR